MVKSSRNSAARSAVRDDGVITLERHQHGQVTRSDKQILDDAGLISRPFFARDILDTMESRGTITREMRAAGNHFRERFACANLEALRCADVERIPRLGWRPGVDPVEAIAASDDVDAMMRKVGCPGNDCLWHVLGLGTSLKDWSRDQSWYSNRPCNPMVASGILVAALGTLAA